MPILQLIITHHFTCGRRKISRNIKNSQNITAIVVCKRFLCFLCHYQQLQLFITVMLWLDLLYLPKETPQTKVENLSIPNFDLKENVGKVIINQDKFQHFFAGQMLQFQVKIFQIKGFKITKIVEQIKFNRTWGKLEAKNCFHIKSMAIHLRQTLIFMSC